LNHYTPFESLSLHTLCITTYQESLPARIIRRTGGDSVLREGRDSKDRNEVKKKTTLYDLTIGTAVYLFKTKALATIAIIYLLQYTVLSGTFSLLVS
jgi:hypothetical protein